MSSVVTFDQLGIPFRLFRAPVKEAFEYQGEGKCVFCRRENVHCFGTEVGFGLAVDCGVCETLNYVDASGRELSRCRRCGNPVGLSHALGDNHVRICYSCLRDGKAAMTKDTALGMVSWEQAFEGMTHGPPGLCSDNFEVVPSTDNHEWMKVLVPSGLLFELLRTPTYLTIQGECWQFCCRSPMIYVGEWKEREFARKAPDGNGKEFFESIFRAAGSHDKPSPDFWGHLDSMGGPYMFRCETCGKLDGHYDMD